MSASTDRLVAHYLKRLDRELRDLPRSGRRELLEEIEGHIAEARSAPEAETEAGIRTLLERLGEPAEIAADARERFGVHPRRGGMVEILALIGLLIGGFFFVVGWFAGLVLLWVSDVWTTREKLVGTFLVPGGLLPALLMFGGVIGDQTISCSGQYDEQAGQFVEVCTGGHSLPWQIFWITLFVVSVIGPFFTTIFLARRMRRGPASAAYQPSAGSA